MVIYETERLSFRKIKKEDFDELCLILKDSEVMYAWEHAFTDDEVLAWIEKNLSRYGNEGYSYFAVILKETGKLIGLMGPLVEEIEGSKYTGIAYIFNKDYWHKGYALEGAKATLAYAFKVLKADYVIAEIRPENKASRRLAESLNMQIEGEFIKKYKGKEMVHLIYSIKAE